VLIFHDLRYRLFLLLFKFSQFLLNRPVGKGQVENENYIRYGHEHQQAEGPAKACLGRDLAKDQYLYGNRYQGDEDKKQDKNCLERNVRTTTFHFFPFQSGFTDLRSLIRCTAVKANCIIIAAGQFPTREIYSIVLTIEISRLFAGK